MLLYQICFFVNSLTKLEAQMISRCDYSTLEVRNRDGTLVPSSPQPPTTPPTSPPSVSDVDFEALGFAGTVVAIIFFIIVIFNVPSWAHVSKEKEHFHFYALYIDE